MAFVICSEPVCGLPVAVPADLIQQIDYPADVDAVADLIYGRFNSLRHTCGSQVIFKTRVTAVCAPLRKLVVLGDPDADLLHRAESGGYALFTVEDYAGLTQHVVGWFTQDVRAFWRSLVNGAYSRATPREMLAAITPVRVLSMKLSRDGLAQVVVHDEEESAASPATASDSQIQAELGSLGVQLTAEQVVRAVRLAIVDKRGGDLETALLERVPLYCLDEPVLQELAAEAELEPAKSTEDTVRQFTALVACALAHRLAECANPVAMQLVAFMYWLHGRSERDGVQLDERFWLTPEQFRRITDGAAALQVALAGDGPAEKGGTRMPSVTFLARIGWADLLSGMTIKPARDGSPAPAKSGTDEVRAAVLDLIAYWDPQYGDWALGIAMAGVFDMQNADFESVDSEFHNTVAEILGERVSPLAALGFLADYIRHANLRFRTHDAVAAGESALTALERTDPGPVLHAAVLTEVGNAYRFKQGWDRALTLYDQAEEQSRREPEGLADREHVLERNRALVYRDSRRYGDAEAILFKHVQSAPDSFEALESLVLLYLDIGRHGEGLVLVNRRLARPDLSPFHTGRIELMKGRLLTELGRHDAAVDACIAAMGILGINPAHRLQVENSALLTSPADERNIAFVDGCERHVVELMANPTLDHPILTYSGALLVALRRLRTGRIIEAGELIGLLLGRADELNWGMSWHLDLIVGWYALENGEPEAFSLLVQALSRLEHRLPKDSDAGYAMGALGGLAVEDLQHAAVRAGAAAVTTDGAVADALVPVLDFTVGRDLVARAGSNSEIELPDAGGATVDAVDEWQRSVGADIVAFIEDTPTLQLLIQPAAGRRYVVDTSVPMADVAAGARSLRSFDFTNPLRPERMDTRLTPWWETISVVASMLRRELPGDGELVFVPGRTLANTPLHAAGWPGRPLIADRPVSVTPNHRLLTARRIGTQRPETEFGVIAVPKANDAASFTERMTAFTAEIRLGQAAGARIVSGGQANRAATLEVLGGSRAVLLLCHGIHGGPGLGPGICVAADGLLPPAQLDVLANPALAAFVLGWSDVATVPRSADLLVSLACSSARAVLGPGGSRLGLEQGTLANATRFMVAPLWPVEQQASLLWTDHFFAPMKQATDVSPAPLDDVPRLHRQATSAVAARYPHPFHWAPFILATALRGIPS